MAPKCNFQILAQQVACHSQPNQVVDHMTVQSQPIKVGNSIQIPPPLLGFFNSVIEGIPIVSSPLRARSVFTRSAYTSEGSLVKSNGEVGGAGCLG